jgi:hypothetical protein
MSSILNKTAIKTIALGLADKRFKGKFTRVSKEYLDDLEARVRNMIEKDIFCLPSVGKTVYPSIRKIKDETNDSPE